MIQRKRLTTPWLGRDGIDPPGGFTAASLGVLSCEEGVQFFTGVGYSRKLVANVSSALIYVPTHPLQFVRVCVRRAEAIQRAGQELALVRVRYCLEHVHCSHDVVRVFPIRPSAAKHCVVFVGNALRQGTNELWVEFALDGSGDNMPGQGCEPFSRCLCLTHRLLVHAIPLNADQLCPPQFAYQPSIENC